jgi:hypothetical protein
VILHTCEDVSEVLEGVDATRLAPRHERVDPRCAAAPRTMNRANSTAA